MLINISLPADVTYILNKLDEHGFAGYIVGGCVRDILLNKEPVDWDITTNAQPDQVKQLFPKSIDTGIKHGTVTVFINGKQYEITTFRQSDYRRSDNILLLKGDLSRRDFTINAMAYNHQRGLVDYFNGVKDLKEGIINAVGDPEKRFQEDALRMVRAIRLACQLDFEIAPKTFAAITRNHQLLKSISTERIRDEFCKILLIEQPGRGIQMLYSTLLMDFILPELTCIDLDHTLAVIGATPKDLTVRLAALFLDIDKPQERAKIARNALKRLKFSNKTIDAIYRLLQEFKLPDYSDEVSIKRFINRVGQENLQSFFELQLAVIKACKPPHGFSAVDALKEQVYKIIKEKQPLTIKDLAVNGYDLIKIGIQPGVQMGQILNYLLEKVLTKPELNTKENLLNIVLSEKHNV